MFKGRYRLSTFKSKLIAMMLGGTFISLFVASLSLALVQFDNYRKSLETSMLSNTAILAFNLAPTLVFDDVASAKQLLLSLKTQPHIKVAKAYRIDEQGQLKQMVSYHEAEWLPESEHEILDINQYMQALFEGDDFKVTHPIKLDDELIGYLYIHSIFGQFHQFQIHMLRVGLTVLVISLLLALMISLKFQQILLRPLSHLVALTQEVSRHKDYALRAETGSNDEFSHLASSFNHMLQDIQTHVLTQKTTEDEIRQLNLHLEDKVKARTDELEQSNQVLRTTLHELNESQEQLVEKEKMASLGGLVAGIAHEVNTPIGIGVSAVSHLEELLKQLEAKYESKNLRQKDLADFIITAKEGTSITFNNLSRAADLVRSFKQVVVDQSSDNIRTVNVKEYVHDILMSLRPQLKKTPHEIDLHLEKNLVIKCNAGALSQIMTNLIMNSLIHAFKEGDKGTIKIEAKKNGNQIYFCYEDDGVGMPINSLKHLFEPFYTTRRNKGGSGLGAHLIYNLVTQGLHGKISVSNKTEGGLRFDIEFPDLVSPVAP